MNIGGNLTVGPAGAINVDAKGFAVGQGPAPGFGAGASHGGMGSPYYTWAGAGPTYGSVYEPTNLGSGGSTYGGISPVGGGAVYLQVGGLAMLDGMISACGTGGYRAAGSSGGSIFLRAGSMAGTGVVDAAGGASSSLTGAGGGGRVAVILTNSLSFGEVRITAAGAPGVEFASAAGTVYLQDASQTAGQGVLIVDNRNLTGLNSWRVCTLIPAASAFNPSYDLRNLAAIIITNRGILGIGPDTALDFSTARIVAAGGLAPVLAAPGAPAAAAIALRSTNLVTFPSDFTISNYCLCLDVPVQAQGHWRILTNSSLSHSSNNDPAPGAEEFRLRLTLDGNLTIEPGGAVDVNSKGYRAFCGPAPGTYGQGQRGASHGGRGGLTALPPYGATLTPQTLGSGGGQYTGSSVARPGAGSAELVVSGTTAVYGVIRAAQALLAESRCAGAAGGSIYLRTGWLVGDGLITANGDDSGNDNSAPGGGGRIAVVLTQSDSFDQVRMTARGCNVTYKSAAGTIYRQRASDRPGWGVLVVDNTNIVTTLTTTTDLPAAGAGAGELKGAALTVLGGRVNVTTNLVLGDLWLLSTNAFLYLNGRSIWVRAAYHDDWGAPAQVEYLGGRIFWGSAGTVLTVH